MKEFIYRGNAWKCSDDVLLFDIIPQKYWFKSSDVMKGEKELGEHVMEGIDPNFAKHALAGRYKVIVAGKNFGGGGKSLEHPVFAIKGAGINVVMAESFSRYFFRNAINNGLPVLACKGITEFVETGDELEVNLNTGEIKDVTRSKTIKTPPLPDFILSLISDGGYIPYTRKKLRSEL